MLDKENEDKRGKKLIKKFWFCDIKIFSTDTLGCKYLGCISITHELM